MKYLAVIIFFLLCFGFPPVGVSAADSSSLPTSGYGINPDLNSQTLAAGNANLHLAPVITQRFPVVVEALTSALKLKKIRIPVEISIWDKISNLPMKAKNVLTQPEAYWLVVSPQKISIIASDQHGTIYGMIRLETMLLNSDKQLPEAEILDSPDHKIRALHLVLRKVEYGDVLRIIDLARANQFNTIILMLADGVRLKSLERVVTNDAWSIETFLKLVNYARASGLEVIPEVKLLTHQEKLLKNKFPGLLFNRSTYDPTNPEVYEVVFSIIDELVKLLQPRVIHIGHDEVAGHNERSRLKWLKPGQPMLPAELFLQDVKLIHNYLADRGIETWMWGDMLISPDEFPEMRSNYLHGGVLGYGKPLRAKIPKNIVITDWHYVDRQENFPSLVQFSREGFIVLGSTWKREDTISNFSRYAAENGAAGMIASTWFHVQRKEFDVVESIIATSGRLFWKTKSSSLYNP